MNINILCVGKIKEKYLRDAIDEYSKRLKVFCRLNIIEVPDEKTPEGASKKEEAMILEKEGSLLLKALPQNTKVIALCIDGKMLSSEELSSYISKSMTEGNSAFTFIIGGSLGLSKEVISHADFLLSFSPMTFPHQLMRVILLEQVYRSFKIMKGEPYHK